MMLVWALWFSKTAREDKRVQLATLLLLSVPALAIGRLLATSLPFRLRPVHDTLAGLTYPLGMPPAVLSSWSSMPSDHAVLYFTLATGLFLISRAAGLAALFHAALIISLPRIVLGLHYPGDILIGALIGCAFVLILLRPATNLAAKTGLLPYQTLHPKLFYAVMLFITFQIATMFESLRAILRTTRDILAA